MAQNKFKFSCLQQMENGTEEAVRQNTICKVSQSYGDLISIPMFLHRYLASLLQFSINIAERTTGVGGFSFWPKFEWP